MHALKLDTMMQFTHKDDVFYCNGQAMDLRDSPLTAKLMQLFFTFPHEVITRDDILRYVYRLDLEKDYSSRYWDTCVHNVIKLVSRARLHSRRHWPDTTGMSAVKWFQFDNIAGGWRLYTLNAGRVALKPYAV